MRNGTMRSYRLILAGFVFVLSTICLVVLLYKAVTSIKIEPAQKFRVVDIYEGCDVVEYNNPRLANAHYFLDCRNGKSVELH